MTLSCAIMLMAIMGSACSPKTTSHPPVGMEAPDWQAVRSVWNARADSIKHLNGRGIFESRWTDSDGHAHVDQGDLDLWYAQPNRLATRLSKFGDTIAVTGMNEKKMWIYLAEDPSVLYVGSHDDGSLLMLANVPFDPEIYLFMMGLAPLAQQTAEPDIRWDSEASAWVITLHSLKFGAPHRMWVSSGMTIPFRMEFLIGSRKDRLRVDYDRRRIRSIELPGQNVDTWPTFANAWSVELIRDGRSESRSLVVFDVLTVEVEGEPMDRVFNVEIMTEGLAPDSVLPLKQYGRLDKDGS